MLRARDVRLRAQRGGGPAIFRHRGIVPGEFRQELLIAAAVNPPQVPPEKKIVEPDSGACRGKSVENALRHTRSAGQRLKVKVMFPARQQTFLPDVGKVTVHAEGIDVGNPAYWEAQKTRLKRK